MKTWPVIVGLLLVLGVLDAARAQPSGLPTTSTWSIEPANPTTRDDIRVRNVFTGCFDFPFHGARVNLATNRISLLGGGTDTCYPTTNQVSEVRVGYLPPGAYVVEFLTCGDGLHFPEDECHQSPLPDIAFGVTDAGRPRHVIPASSPAINLLLGTLLAAGALLSLRRRS